MPKSHLEHPSQATACGTLATQTGLSREQFLAASDRCRSCERTLEADDAGRPAYSGEVGTLNAGQKLSDLSREQRGFLARVAREPAGLLVENRSTAAASLVRKGFALKVLTRDKPAVETRFLRGQLARLTLTDAGRAWLEKFGEIFPKST